MNNYNEKEIIALLQDPTRQREAFEAVVRAYSEQIYWHNASPMTFMSFCNASYLYTEDCAILT